jgi:hypothetical protein
MNNMVLQCNEGGNFEPHPEGIHPAVCVGVLDLGLVETEFQGQRSLKPKVKVTFESEAKTSDGKPCTVSKSFTASLHPKSNLSAFIGKWRGRPVLPGETISLDKLIGACCTLVISHQKNMVGKTYASIDAVSKPTRKVTPSGTYDPEAARQRYADWKAKASATPANMPAHHAAPPVAAPRATMPAAPANAPSKSGAAVAAPAADFDPEVGF